MGPAGWVVASWPRSLGDQTRVEGPSHYTPVAFSSLFKSAGVAGRSRALIESCPVSLCLWPLLWWVHSASGHKELMAVGIMQWHARRLSSPPPLWTGWSQIRHSCTFRSDASECCGSAAHVLALTWEQNEDFVSLWRRAPPTPNRASHLPYGGKVVLRIYNLRSGWYLSKQCSSF